MYTIGLSMDQQVRVVNEFWQVEYNDRPQDGYGVTTDMIYKWIGKRYNCKVIRVQPIAMQFEQEKDLTFFLLKHS